jgi:hypothetical protein
MLINILKLRLSILSFPCLNNSIHSSTQILICGCGTYALFEINAEHLRNVNEILRKIVRYGKVVPVLN